VIPNGRIFPSELTDAIVAQAAGDDEILVVQNDARRAKRHWTGLDSSESSPRQPRLTRHARVRALQSDPGAAAARNAGWRAAAHAWVLFVDDAVPVPATFRAQVRSVIAERSDPRVMTFRVLTAANDPAVAIVGAFVTLDRGSGVLRAPDSPLPLNESWRYGGG